MHCGTYEVLFPHWEDGAPLLSIENILLYNILILWSSFTEFMEDGWNGKKICITGVHVGCNLMNVMSAHNNFLSCKLIGTSVNWQQFWLKKSLLMQIGNAWSGNDIEMFCFKFRMQSWRIRQNFILQIWWWNRDFLPPEKKWVSSING